VDSELILFAGFIGHCAYIAVLPACQLGVTSFGLIVTFVTC